MCRQENNGEMLMMSYYALQRDLKRQEMLRNRQPMNDDEALEFLLKHECTFTWERIAEETKRTYEDLKALYDAHFEQRKKHSSVTL